MWGGEGGGRGVRISGLGARFAFQLIREVSHVFRGPHCRSVVFKLEEWSFAFFLIKWQLSVRPVVSLACLLALKFRCHVVGWEEALKKKKFLKMPIWS